MKNPDMNPACIIDINDTGYHHRAAIETIPGKSVKVKGIAVLTFWKLCIGKKCTVRGAQTVFSIDTADLFATNLRYYLCLPRRGRLLTRSQPQASMMNKAVVLMSLLALHVAHVSGTTATTSVYKTKDCTGDTLTLPYLYMWQWHVN